MGGWTEAWAGSPSEHKLSIIKIAEMCTIRRLEIMIRFMRDYARPASLPSQATTQETAQAVAIIHMSGNILPLIGICTAYTYIALVLLLLPPPLPPPPPPPP